jgi:predicted RNase H-like HicB family nuclease
MRYAVIFERGPTSFGAYVPDLPGCVAVGQTAEEVRKLIAEAIEFHAESLRRAGGNLSPNRPASVNISKRNEPG